MHGESRRWKKHTWVYERTVKDSRTGSSKSVIQPSIAAGVRRSLVRLTFNNKYGYFREIVGVSSTKCLIPRPHWIASSPGYFGVERDGKVSLCVRARQRSEEGDSNERG